MKLLAHQPAIELMRNVLVNGIVVIWSHEFLDENLIADDLRTGKLGFYANTTVVKVLAILEDPDPEYNVYVVTYEASVVELDYHPEMDIVLAV